MDAIDAGCSVAGNTHPVDGGKQEEEKLTAQVESSFFFMVGFWSGSLPARLPGTCIRRTPPSHLVPVEAAVALSTAPARC